MRGPLPIPFVGSAQRVAQLLLGLDYRVLGDLRHELLQDLLAGALCADPLFIEPSGLDAFFEGLTQEGLYGDPVELFEAGDLTVLACVVVQPELLEDTLLRDAAQDLGRFFLWTRTSLAARPPAVSRPRPATRRRSRKRP